MFIAFNPVKQFQQPKYRCRGRKLGTEMLCQQNIGECHYSPSFQFILMFQLHNLETTVTVLCGYYPLCLSLYFLFIPSCSSDVSSGSLNENLLSFFFFFLPQGREVMMYLHLFSLYICLSLCLYTPLCLCFSLSNAFILPQFLKDHFIRYRILD